MARIRPFSAWRYNHEQVEDIQKKFSPLFDVVGPEQLEALYEIPNNSIHISVPRSEEQALGKLEEWKERGIIHQDPVPGIYVYYQEFSLFGEARRFVRKGFVSMIKVNEDSGKPSSDIVLHEGTIASSVAGRSRLLEKMRLNIAPTHGLYEDPEFELETLMDAYMEEPLYEYLDYQGVLNKLAIVQDRRDVERFMEVLQDKTVYLADGHHRLASSVALHQKMQDRAEELPADSLMSYHLMYLTNMCADDLRILPIHRVLHLPEKTFNPNPILEKLEQWYEVSEITFDRKPIYTHVQEHSRSMVMVLGSLHFLLVLRSDMDPQQVIDLDLPPAVKDLDYTLLHYLVFDKVFGHAYAEQAHVDDIRYIKDMGQAAKQAVTYRDRVAFIMGGTSMQQMMEVCKSKSLMPQKSTYFYPKVVCGLVFGSIDDHENDSAFDLSFRLPAAEATAQ